MPPLAKDAWFIGGDAEHCLKEKIERIGKPLREWDVNIYYGIKTGLNEAFIIDTATRQRILDACKDAAERQRTEAIIKPILRGRDIKRYTYEWKGLWIIGTFPALRLDIDDFPALKKYFLDNFDIRQLEQSGKKYPNLGFDARKKTNNKWFETQDQIAYYPEFEKEKVVWPSVGETLYCLVSAGFFVLDTNYFTTSLGIYHIGLLNSCLIRSYINSVDTKLGESVYRHYKYNFERIPIPPITPQNQPLVAQIEALVDQILARKRGNPHADTRDLERDIDQLVYRLYDLTPDEIRLVEGG